MRLCENFGASFLYAAFFWILNLGCFKSIKITFLTGFIAQYFVAFFIDHPVCINCKPLLDIINFLRLVLSNQWSFHHCSKSCWYFWSWVYCLFHHKRYSTVKIFLKNPMINIPGIKNPVNNQPGRLTLPTYFLICLSVVDFLFCLLIMPPHAYVYFYNGMPYDKKHCKALGFTEKIIMYGERTLLAVIALSSFRRDISQICTPYF